MKSTASPAAFIEEARAMARPLEQQIRVQKYDSERKLLPYSRRDYYKIWITTAKGAMHYATRTIELTQPALIFSNPRVPYAFESVGRNAGYMCIFTEEFLRISGIAGSLQDSPLFRIGSSPVFFLDQSKLDFIGAFYEQMISESQSDYPHRFDVLRHYVNLLIHEGMKMEPALHAITPHNAAERITGLFLELLDRQFPIESPQQALKLRRAGDYAENLSVHVNHLNHVVREVTGKPTTAHISERIAVEAKALLRHSRMSIADIAYCLGFESPNYFNTFFKKNTGSTPLAFRK